MDGASGGQIRRPVKTTLDLDLQLYAEERLGVELAKLALNRVSDGSVLAIENSTRATLCYMGSASWFDDAVSGKIDGVQARNQPGSCLKPFLYALDSGFCPNAILPDFRVFLARKKRIYRRILTAGITGRCVCGLRSPRL
ncbi:MAG: hypothetical protein LBL45_00560 [Treponema sp.]|nr:hypothetical protein [Treponema sp.]